MTRTQAEPVGLPKSIPDAFYVVCHMPGMFPNLPGLTPIYTGKAAASAPENSLNDHVINGQSLENRRWSELSAMYKIWRDGPRSGNVGFFHYRRYFNFSHPGFVDDINDIDRETLEKNNRHTLNRSICGLTSVKTLIVGRERRLPDSVYRCYANWHSASDYLDTHKIVCTKYPKIGRFMTLQFERRTMYACNIFVLRWELFNELCGFWFDVLFEFAGSVSWPRGLGEYQDRDVAFLAERLFDAWLRQKQSTGYKILELPVFFVT